MKTTKLYHAGPKGLTELLPLGLLIRSGRKTVEQACNEWREKWGDCVEPNVLIAHPTMREISFTTDLTEARRIAGLIDGCVYQIEAAPTRINEEGYPVIRTNKPIEVSIAA